MAKKSSKATTPSWRTLMRKANEAERLGFSHKAKSLRVDASKLRKGTRSKSKPASKPRSEVMKKAWATRRAKKLVVADALSPRAEAEAVKAVRADWVNAGNQMRQALTVGGENTATENAPGGFNQSATLRFTPGRGEIVGGAEYNLAEEIAMLARKKGGKDAIQNRITNALAIARAEGQRIADKGAREMREEIVRINNQRIVCAFLSEIDVHERAGELLPDSPPWTVSALTLTKVAAALRAAGYTGRGMQRL